MKKIMVVMIVVLFALAISACGGNGGGAADGGGGQAAGNGAAAGNGGGAADGGAAAADDDSVTIIHWVWGDFEERGSYRFYRYFPNINIEYLVFPTDEFVARFQTTVAGGGELPDVFNIEMGFRALMHSLDNVFYVLDDDPFNVDRSLIVDWAIPFLTNPQGQILSVQIDNCVGGFIYNRPLALEFFGTDDPDELEAMFQTPQDYVYWAARVNEQSGGRVQMFASGMDAFRAFGSLGLGNSAPVVINDYQLNVRNIFMDTFNIMEGLAANNGIATFTAWTPAWMAAFTSGDVIFFPGPFWFMSHVLMPNDPDGAGNWGVIAPPGGAFSWGGTSYAIPIGAQNPEAAWEWIRWFTLTQEGTESFFSAHATPTLFAPAYLTDLYVGNYDPFFAGQDVVSKLLEIAMDPATQTRPISIFDNAFDEALLPVFVEMIDNGMSAADAMTMLEDEMIFIDARLHR